MCGKSELLNDTRPIKGVWWNGGNEESGYSVGFQDVTHIRVYQDYGNGAHVSWLAVYKGDHLHARVNVCAIGAEIIYDDAVKSGEPCDHPGCMNHVTHQCEGCGGKGNQNGSN